jgi:4,5-DOPA dioxygenase extradiol
MTPAGRVPPIFVSHSGEAGGEELAAWARELPRPRGILVVSASWSEDVLTRGSTAARPALLVDGLGAAAARASYPAPGAPDLAYELASLGSVEPSLRGWDQGVWGPLSSMFPAADVPVLQLSLVTGANPRRLFGIGRTLGALPARGYLVMGVGAITESPKERAPAMDAPVADWARVFDGWIANVLADAELDELFAWRKRAPYAKQAHGTPARLDPLFVVAGAASVEEHAVGFPIRGFEHGSFSRRCVQFGRTQL